MMKKRSLGFLPLAYLLAGMSGAAPVPSGVAVNVDYPAFLARQDMVFDKLPDQFDTGAFLGNGMLASTIYQTGSNTLRWEMGRSDVTEHRRDNNRLPIGGLVLTTAGRIENGTMRVDLWNAEVRGEVKTDQGAIKFRSFIHTKGMVLFIDLETEGAESAARFAWDAALCRDFINWPDTHPNGFWNEPPNPPARTETIDGMPVCIQERHGHGMYAPDEGGGEHATAWTEKRFPKGRRVILSIADSWPANTARFEVVKTVKSAVAADFGKMLESHRAWWHDFYPKSFVSIPDPQAESFYWIQWYKLASASRPDSPPLDEIGPWFRKTQWPRIWWNLNIQIAYLPVYTGNRLELGEAFVNFIDQKRANFFRNGKDLWHFDDVATVPHTTDNQGLGGNGSRGGYVNPADFPWALHDYYLHYRSTMDHSMVTDHDQHAFYPLLRGAMNLYLHIMKEGGDGKLHLPKLNSPEFADDVDNNYQLSLFRWGCRTLLDLNERYQINDPLAPKWRDALDRLVPYAVDETGLRIGPNVAMHASHRHWSHLLMIHPLHIMTGDRPRERDLMKRSIHHWLTVGNQEQTWPSARAAGASLYATLGDGDNAIDQIQRHMAGTSFVQPNTMYIEGGNPVVECSIILNGSVQDMLLQSWGDKIHVFPAVPRSWNKWNDAVFHDLRAEGAFLVSAAWKDGRTSWIRIKSLAGEPCRIKTDLPENMVVHINGKPGQVKPSGAGVFELPLAKGDEAFLTETAQVIPVVTPVASTWANPWGVKDPASKPPPRVLAPSLNQGKAMTASSTQGAGYEAAAAADGDLTTRWAAAGGQRSAWLEVDLGQPVLVGRAVVRELAGPRIRKFAVDVLEGESWKPLAGATKVGVVCVLDFPPVTARKFRLNIGEAADTPTIEEWGLYPPLAGAEPTLSADSDLLSFACNGTAAMLSPDDDAITLVLPQGTDLTKLAPVCTVSPFASVSPASGAKVDFSNSKRTPVLYTVTAQATHYTRVYKVTVCVSEPGTQLLRNPGFETGDLAGWASGNDGNGGYLGVDGVILWDEGQPSYTPHQGDKMGRLQGPAVGLSQTVALAAGDHALGMWVQSRRLAGNQLDPGLALELLDKAGKPVAPTVASSPAFTPPAGWVHWTRSYTSLPAGTYSVRVRTAASAAAQGWVDDFSLIQGKNR
jgi:alpha-L-fucosidase 2